MLLGRVKVPEQLEVAKRFGVSGYPLLFMDPEKKMVWDGGWPMVWGGGDDGLGNTCITACILQGTLVC